MLDYDFLQDGTLRTSFPIRTVAVVYCTSTGYALGRDNEKKADCEVIEVAQAIRASLEAHGCEVELVDLVSTRIEKLLNYDWVFNLAESVNGFPLADYEVAEQLENLNVHFTGSGSTALKNCLDKATTKYELLRSGIATPDYELFQPGSKIYNLLPYPLIVKPVHEDGSIGITRNSRVKNAIELEKQVHYIHETYQQAALVEEYIEGRDITASIIGNRSQAEVLPLSEISYNKQVAYRFLTFNAKWESETMEYKLSTAHCPCQLDLDVEQSIQTIALQAYRVMGCRDYARVDFRLRGNQPFVLEVNPNPCINPVDSGFVRCCKANGTSYSEMTLKILTHSVRNFLYEPSKVQLNIK